MSLPWRARLLLLAAAGLPAFTGWPLADVELAVLPGLRVAWLGYLLVVHLLARGLCGGRRYADILALAAMISLPVVFGGAAVTALFGLLQGATAVERAAAGAHYVSLGVTMLTVVPLALAMVVQVPFGRLEQGLLEGRRGVGRRAKASLMALRVFNHVVYFVIPNILEVLREEDGPGRRRHLLWTLIHVGVEAICGAVRYVPLWALEIAALPDGEGEGRG